MSAPEPDSAALRLRLDDLGDRPLDCARAVPGVGNDNPKVMDLSARPTTEDQARIEAVLEHVLAPGARVLHVGVGNSSLALRFADRCSAIVGLTLSEAERTHAERLGLNAYEVRIANKYGADLDAVEGPFDVIVDNNPASFTCCQRHLERMLANYARLLAAGGRMLTDREGMHWCYANGPWRLRFHHLQAIGEAFGLDAERLGPQVFALRRPDPRTASGAS